MKNQNITNELVSCSEIGLAAKILQFEKDNKNYILDTREIRPVSKRWQKMF